MTKTRILSRPARRTHIFVTINEGGYQSSIVRGWWAGHARALILRLMGHDVRFDTSGKIRRGR